LEEVGPASFGSAVPSEMVARTGAGIDVEGSATGVVPRLLVLLVVVVPVVVVVAGAAPPSPFATTVAFVGLMLVD
jgi:hypothetical protein